MRAIVIITLLVLLVLGLNWLGQQPTVEAPAPGATPNPGVTPAPGLFGLVKGQLDAQGTASAARLTSVAINATAFAAGQDANSYIARQTAVAFASTAEAGDRQATATAAVEQAATTRQAVVAATATQQAWEIIRMTAAASDAQNTVEAKRQATADAVQLRALESRQRQTDVAAEHVAAGLHLDEQRQAAVNQVMAWAPYGLYLLLALLVVGLVLLLAIRLWRTPVQVVRQNPAGELPLLIDRFGNLVLPGRLPAALVHLLTNGAAAPQLAAPEVQERTVARAQAVEMSTHAQPGSARPEAVAPPATQPNTALSNFRIFGPDETPGPLGQDPDTLRVLDGQWQEAAA